MNDAWARRIAVAAALCVAAWASAQEIPQKLSQIRLNAGIHLINAELATTPEQREIGLMMRPSMPVNDGMLFVFEQPGQQCFWMKNTLIPLSVAFLADAQTATHSAAATAIRRAQASFMLLHPT